VSDSEKTFTVRLSPDLIARVQRKIVDSGGQAKGYSQTSVVRELLEAWLGGTRSIELVPPSVAPKAINEDLERLKAILELGSHSQREAVRGVIKTVSEAIHAGSSPNPSRSRTPPKARKKVG
jgi:hypothetical protein